MVLQNVRVKLNLFFINAGSGHLNGPIDKGILENLQTMSNVHAESSPFLYNESSKNLDYINEMNSYSMIKLNLDRSLYG